MRRLFKGFARGVLAVSVIAVLAVPAEARPFDDGWSIKKGIIRIAKIVKSLGDGLVDPRP